MNAASRGWMISIILIVFSLSACSSTDITMITENEEVSGEQIVLRYSSYLLDTAQAGKVYYDAIKQFEEENPGIKIEADFIQNNNYTAGIKIRLLGGEQLDVFDTWSPSLFQEFRALRSDVYLELTDTAFVNDFYPNSLKPVTIEGKVYGAPEVMHSDGLLYNQTLFNRLGLELPRTWNELLLVCEKLKGERVIPIAMDSEWSTAQFFWGSIMSNAGADEEWTRKLESGEIKITDPLFVEAIKMHKEIIERGYVPSNWLSLKHEQSKDLIGHGKAAMIMTGTWDIPSIRQRNPSNDIRFMSVPGQIKTVPNINVGTYRVINSKTKYPEEAKKFVTFMTGRATQEKLAAGASAVPSVVSAQIDDPVAAQIAEAVTRDNAILFWPHMVSTETLQTHIQESVNRYLSGQSLEETLREIQLVINSVANKR
ncbi:ABC transporter substrate-binding protein [Paenibacillus sp. FSL R7-0331]|uniref:ABC transporter substrate-binding protein n=1 Tax=Paenibacillus sp. FSL R7-0331 TaxID=1536773 RepID=UPI001E451269|nr:extracellular solute-binding protein [Paenibacillus sp. FSL R7-0331]